MRKMQNLAGFAICMSILHVKRKVECIGKRDVFPNSSTYT